jgi:hypothetical protein
MLYPPELRELCWTIKPFCGALLIPAQPQHNILELVPNRPRLLPTIQTR